MKLTYKQNLWKKLFFYILIEFDVTFFRRLASLIRSGRYNTKFGFMSKLNISIFSVHVSVQYQAIYSRNRLVGQVFFQHKKSDCDKVACALNAVWRAYAPNHIRHTSITWLYVISPCRNYDWNDISCCSYQVKKYTNFASFL